MANENENKKPEGEQKPSGEQKPNPEQKPEMVSKSELDKVLNEMHSYKTKAKEAEKLINDIKEKQMKDQNQWKELAESKEKEALEVKTENERLKNSFVNEKKYSALKTAAEKLGLRAEAVSDLESLDLEGIQLETTSTGKINVLNAEKFAERIKSVKPHWFADKNPPNVNTHGTRVMDDTSGEVTVSMLNKAEAEYRKSGNAHEYSQLTKKYQSQQMAKRRLV